MIRKHACPIQLEMLPDTIKYHKRTGSEGDYGFIYDKPIIIKNVRFEFVQTELDIKGFYIAKSKGRIFFGAKFTEPYIRVYIGDKITFEDEDFFVTEFYNHRDYDGSAHHYEVRVE